MKKKIITSLFILSMSSITLSAALLESGTTTLQLTDDTTASKQELFERIREGDLGRVKTLLAEKANLVSDTNDSGSTPLHLAVLFSRFDIVQFLIKKADVNAHNKRDGNTPLHDAVDEGNEDIVKLLIKYKADVSLQNDDGNTPYDEAQKKGKTAIMELLLKAAAQPRSKVVHPLPKASTHEETLSKDHVTAFEGCYIEDVKDNKHTESRDSKRGGEIIRKTKNTQKKKRKEPIGSKKGALLVGGKRSKTNQGGKGKLESISKKALSKTGQGEYDRQLLEAAEDGRNEEAQRLLTGVKRLLETGASLEAVNNNGSTPLHVAAGIGDRGIATLLIENHANLEVINKYGNTPLHVAAEVGHREVVELLISSGANLESEDNNRSTPLHVAAFYGKTEVARLLIDNHANIKAVNQYRWTPLQCARNQGHQAIIDLLISKASTQ